MIRYMDFLLSSISLRWCRFFNLGPKWGMPPPPPPCKESPQLNETKNVKYARVWLPTPEFLWVVNQRSTSSGTGALASFISEVRTPRLELWGGLGQAFLGATELITVYIDK